jgi:broad specificity phosphatase PhoE
MGNLYLVRHGQASFGADDYDQLSPLGQQQSVRLGEYFRSKGVTFEAMLSGTLRRQQQTLAGICQGLAQPSPEVTPQRWPGLNEYDSEAVIDAFHPHPRAKPDTPELYRQHFRLLRDGLIHWMHGQTQPRGMPNWVDFQRGVTDVLDHVRAHYPGNVLLVASGGPIATAVGHVLGTAPQATVELNMRLRNSAVSEFSFTPKRHILMTYNTLPHLDHADFASWVTYA